MKKAILGELSPTKFLQKYWQKKPLLIRNAYPGFGDLLTKEKLISLSTKNEVQSRLVQYKQKQWSLSYGPFKANNLKKLSGTWALLVQDVNHFIPQAQTLLKEFNFIPHARLDDLMVSFAPNGGGVGPHFDSYDVFLLQGTGKRVWQISKQKDQTLVPNAPLRILKNFNPEQEWLLEPGDMLYLPPNYAHHGIAVGDCMTYSIGFRAPSHQLLINEFLMYLQDRLELPGIYSDPDLKVHAHPAEISTQMIQKISSVLKKMTFDKKDVQHFLGRFLTEPKSHVFFDPPKSPLTKIKFLNKISKSGIHLDLKSQLLFSKDCIFMNGETYSLKSLMKKDLIKLADHREINFKGAIHKNTADLLYEWYLNGYVV